MDTVCLNFGLVRQGDAYRVRFDVNDERQIETNFQADIGERSRLAAVVKKIEADICTRDDLRDLGSELWVGLTSGDISNAVSESWRTSAACVQIRLDLPPELQNVPWECLYDLSRGIFLSAEPNFCVLRHAPALEWHPPSPRPTSDRLRLLAAIPEGSGLAVESEFQSLKRALKDVDIGIIGLTGRVTPDRFSKQLADTAPDILHFVGHGELDSLGGVTLRLNSEEGGQEEFWATDDQIYYYFQAHVVRLAVFNCCYGGRSPRTTLSGLGPLLLKRGVSAVVAMNYPIADDIAHRFSEEFYSALLNGERPGRVDVALQQARTRLFINATTDRWRSFITPVLYLAKGKEKIFDIQNRSDRLHETARVIESEMLVSLPEGFKQQFKNRRCVPIVGPGIVGMPKDRRSVVPSTIRALAEHLANQCAERDSRLLEAAEQVGLDELAFQAVAELFVAEKRRFTLIEAIRLWYEGAEPSPAHMNIASWPVPAIFYTHFDGLLEAAYRILSRTPKIAYSLSNPPDLQQGPVLLLVRGTVTNEASLVLTEIDHEELASSIDHLAPTIEQLTTAVLGRSVIFLGVNPRDLIVRKLARRLVRPGGNQGPAFFVGSHFTAADKAYWRGFDVIWIEEDPVAVVASLSACLKD